jgi:hypothetical protein
MDLKGNYWYMETPSSLKLLNTFTFVGGSEQVHTFKEEGEIIGTHP